MPVGATRYVVTYDIGDPKRLHHVFQALRKYGVHLQLSVFECDLDEQQVVKLRTTLRRIIRATEDQVLFIRIGQSTTAITALGLPYQRPRGEVTIL